MNIQTAGEQKYYDFIQERTKSLRLGMIVWASLLAAAFIASLTNLKIGALLGIIGIVLAVLNVRAQKALKSKLDIIEDKKSFFNQLTAPETVESEEFRLLITAGYVLKYKEDVYIYRLSDMEKTEVGIEKNGTRHLFLTEKNGTRRELADCVKNDSEEFDRVYRAISSRIKS